MQRYALAALALAALAALPHAAARQPGLKASVLIVRDSTEIRQWLARAPDQRGGDAGRMRLVPPGVKVAFPIVASGLVPPAAETTLVASMEFIGPDGRVLARMKDCCKATILGPVNAPNLIALGPVIDASFAATDASGLYRVNVTITDGATTAQASEHFRFEGSGTASPPAAPATGAPAKATQPAPPRLRQDVPERNPGRDADKRNCLELATPAEIIKCTERK